MCCPVGCCSAGWCSDFNCGHADNPYGGVNCSRLAPKEYCADGHTFCFDNITSRGYGQLLPYLALGQQQGYTPVFNASEGANMLNYLNVRAPARPY